MMRRQLMVLAMAAAAAVGAAACEDNLTGGGGEQPPASPPSPAPAGGGGEATPAPAPPPAGGVLASREAQDDGHDLLIEVTGLRRQGETLALQWRITVVQGAEDSSSWNPWSSMGTAALDFTVGGVTLVDPVNSQRYLPARSGGPDGECACTNQTNFSMTEGDTADFFANYAAPPADITTVNVEFPRFGAFTDVPIS